MELFVKAAAGALITVVLCLALAKSGKDISLLLVIAVCCMLLTIAMGLLDPVTDFLRTLETVGKLDSGWLKILLKAVGIGLLSEFAAMICSDAGFGALGKALQTLSAVLILAMSIPIFTQLLSFVEGILEAV